MSIGKQTPSILHFRRPQKRKIEGGAMQNELGIGSQSRRCDDLQAAAETFQRCLGESASHEDAVRDVAFAELVVATADDLERYRIRK